MKNSGFKSVTFGKLMILVGFFLIVPVCIIPFYPEDNRYIWAFVIPSAISILGGIIFDFFVSTKNTNEDFSVKRASIVVFCVWGYSFFIGALPFVIGGELPFIKALFESASGWTTTGLSVMDVREVPHIFLFYRSFMQYCGGLGFVLIMVMLFQGQQAMCLFNAEGHQDQLVPNLKKTARTISTMYFIYLIIGTLAYYFCGLTFFEALNHTMCALSTGGFSTAYDSIGAYNSVYVEGVTIFLMVVGTTNFAVLLLLSKFKFRRVIKVSEVKFFGALLLFTTPLVTGSLATGMYLGGKEGFRVAIFNIISALSTTGYSTMSYSSWPQFSIGVMIILMLIGGGIGSTAGGIKLSRAYLMYRSIKDNIRSKIAPTRSISSSHYFRAQGKTYIDSSLKSEVSGFIFLYLIIFVVGSLAITLTENTSLTSAMFDFASSIGTVGLSIGITGVDTKNLTLIVEMIGMLLGRLEIFMVVVAIHSMIKEGSKIFVRRKI